MSKAERIRKLGKGRRYGRCGSKPKVSNLGMKQYHPTVVFLEGFWAFGMFTQLWDGDQTEASQGPHALSSFELVAQC